MWKRVVFAAGAAGLVAGLALTAVQQARVAPLIHEAEILEASLPAHAGAQEPHPSAPARLASTAVANVVLATGFALVLAAGMLLRGHAGWRAGLGWGLAGYAVFFACPALLLRPELPGMIGAPLDQRTLWWIAIAASTAAGLALVAFGRGLAWRVAGAVILAMPHFAGGPPPAAQSDPAMRVLAADFAMAAALANAILWLLIGAVAGAFLGPGKDVPRPRI